MDEHNGWVPRDFWLEDWEKRVQPAVWRVLGQAGLLSKWNGKPSKKGTGFEQPLARHQHWHIDVSYININGTLYYLCSILDGLQPSGMLHR